MSHSLATSLLRKVDKLTIIFLVDNNIEWMTKLPPGFTHELHQHIPHSPIDPDLGIPVLNFDNFCCGAHGFSALIETQVEGDRASHLTLFDTGPDSMSLVRNIAAMKIPIERVERLILSHWHGDHSRGIPSFLEMRSIAVAVNAGSGGTHTAPCIVDLHPNRPDHRGIAPGPTFDKVICAIPPDPTFEEIEEKGGVVEKRSEGHAVADDTVWVSGEIPRVTDFEGGIMGGMRSVKKEGSTETVWEAEPHIMDERYVGIDVVGKGLVIFSACSHAGIVNVVRDAVKTHKRPIYMIIGGLHCAGPEYASRIPLTVKFLTKDLRPAPTYILPMHCSGFQTKIALEAAFGVGCVPAGVGHKVVVAGDKGHESRLSSATY